MLRQIAVPDKNPPLPMADVVAVHDDKLDDVLKAYVAMLAERYPFSVELKIDANRVAEELAHFWPEDAEWSAQAYEVWQRIDDLVRSVAAITTGSEMVVHITVASTALKPADMPVRQGPVAMATFDGVQGILHHCLLPNGEEPLRSLDALSIPSGLMVMCHAAIGVYETPTDNRDAGLGSGETYSDRNQDQILPTAQQQNTAEEKAVPPAEPARPAAVPAP